MVADWTFSTGTYGPGEHVVEVRAYDFTGHSDIEYLRVGSGSAPEAVETTFDLAPPIPLNEVTPELQDANLEVAHYEHVTEVGDADLTGGYAPDEATGHSAAAAEYRNQLGELNAMFRVMQNTPDEAMETIDLNAAAAAAPDEEPRVTALTVEGAVSSDALGSLEDNVVLRDESPNPLVSATPAQPDGEKVGGHYEWAPLSGVLIARATGENNHFAALGANLKFDASAVNSFVNDGHAYEHNITQYNDDNTSNISHPNCEGEADNFFIDRNAYRPRQGRSWETDLNGVPYFDVNDTDPCTTEDLTIGVYHPNRLVPGHRYSIIMTFPRGEKNRSQIAVDAQKLEKVCPETNPFCVGLDPRQTKVERLISRKRNIPNCFVWRKDAPTEKCANAGG